MAISLYEMWLLGVIVVLFIILHWIFVSMNATRIVILASVFGLCKPYSWKTVLGKNKNYIFSLAMCPDISANLYAALKFENTKDQRAAAFVKH